MHADGTEVFRPRTEEEIAEIEEQNRIASRSNVRSGQDRRWQFKRSEYHVFEKICQRKTVIDRRSILSSFERDFFKEQA